MIQQIIDQLWTMEAWIRTGSIVMIPIIAVSVAMWTLIINRLFFFHRLYRKNMTKTRAGEFIIKNEVPPKKQYRGAVAYVVSKFLKRRTGKYNIDKYILDETIMETITVLDRYLSMIGVLAAIAPLLGLLGTVTGMISTFEIISVFGTGNAKAMAGGISEALITTQTGLIVAIPGLYMHGFLEKQAYKLKARIAATGIYLQRYIST